MIEQGKAADGYENPTNDRDRKWTFIQGYSGILNELCQINNGFCSQGLALDLNFGWRGCDPKAFAWRRKVELYCVCNCVC